MSQSGWLKPAAWLCSGPLLTSQQARECQATAMPSAADQCRVRGSLSPTPDKLQ